jgi:hypothetical protein
MAQERSVTPEKQLLKLIEDPKTKGTDFRTHAIKHHGLSLFSSLAWKGRLSFLKVHFQKWLKRATPQPLNIKVVNRVLVLCIFIMVVYFAKSIPASIIKLKKMPTLEFKTQGGIIEKSAGIEEASLVKKAASYYLEKVRQKDIFRMGAKVGPVTEKSTAKAPSSRIMEATQYFKLVGISWSRDPDVMIEDTKALRTYFLKRGESIGEVKVQAIFRDKVVLSFGGEEIELK